MATLSPRTSVAVGLRRRRRRARAAAACLAAAGLGGGCSSSDTPADSPAGDAGPAVVDAASADSLAQDGPPEDALPPSDAAPSASDGPRDAARVGEPEPDVGIAPNGLDIRLVWYTPDDPDETDRTGTDVDLHLRWRSPGAPDCWGDGSMGYDCYFSQKQPDWGRVGDPSDDPSLYLDDTNGSGPEVIFYRPPAQDSILEVGVLYFRAESTFGLVDVDPRIEHPAAPHLEIWMDGVRLQVLDGPLLRRRGQLWTAARLELTADGPCTPPACPRITPSIELLEEAAYRCPQ